MKPSLILYAPTPGVERGGGISAARIVEGPEVMDRVLERLGLPTELRGEETPGKTAKGKEQMANGKEGANDKEQRRAARPQPEPEPEPTDENAEPEPELEPTDENAEPEPEPEPEEPTEPEFSEEQRTWMDEQTKAQTAELEQAKADLTAAQERAKELEGKVTALGQTPVALAGINPLFTVDDPSVLAKHEEEIGNFERWALEHWDGVEATEASADGKTPAAPGYSAGQVRKRYAELKEVRDKVIPAARQAIEVRKEQAKIAKGEYPELFDSKRPEAQLAENILRQAPGLKAIFPNIYLVLGDAIRGEKARLAAKKAAAAKTGARPTAGQTNGKPRPARPGAGASATARPKKQDNEISAERFMKLGGGRDALVEMLSGADLPTAER